MSTKKTTRGRRRGLAALIAVSTGAVLLAGCGASSPAEPVALSGTTPAELSGHVTIWTWDVADTALKALIPAFSEKYPDVDVEVVTMGYPDIYDKLSVGLRSGQSLPDIVSIDTNRMAGYLDVFPEGFVDLTPAASALEDDFGKAKWEGSTLDGHLFSLPWDDGPVALYFRRDYFEAAGIDPASLTTWDDYVAAGERIKAATGKKLLLDDIAGGDLLFPMLMQQQGASYFSEDGKVTLDSPEGLAALTLLKRLNDAGLIDNQKGWDGMISGTKSGGSATLPTAVWWIGTLTSSVPEQSGLWGVVPLPAFEPGGATTSNSGGSTLAIPSTSKNREAAWAFMEFALADKQSAATMLETSGLFPSYLPAQDDPYFATPQPYFDGQPVLELFAAASKEVPPFRYTGDSSKADELVVNMVADVLLNGRDPAEALTATAQQLASATGRPLAKG